MADEKSVFVTVGTTSFDRLIETVSSKAFVELFEKLGYHSIVLQIGRGVYEPEIVNRKQFSMKYYRYKDSIAADIQRASLVISHAGAGSVLETLQAGRPLIVVINELLMDNHQLELASQLAEDGHLYYATCSTLEATIRKRNLSELKSFPPGKPELFSSFLDNIMGFGHS
ncbi:Glycosyltransferase 28 C-terminal domain [Desmophyllum pertusum]|uniref:UDP-N-acetylglucosamine transferase subunit ALG13 n=1 Tax=Desmophyllum pertusum TaxID=174260 RepID=A0A9X0D030_9CNID|nr:Glycosyltransferase 28 C-terminal domain [Desmophyllum pertusum]